MSHERGNRAESTFNLLSRLSLVLGILISILSLITMLVNLKLNPTGLLILSIIGFILLAYGILWFVFKVPAAQRWKWLALLLFYALSLAMTWWWSKELWKRPFERFTFPIEKGQVTSFDYDGIRNPQVGKGYGNLMVQTDFSGSQPRVTYNFDYDIPTGGSAYSGFALRFAEAFDMSSYPLLRFTIKFSDDQSRARLVLRDEFDKTSQVVLGDGKIIAPVLTATQVEIPLKEYFSGISFNHIKEVVFDVNEQFTQGKHAFSVSDILLIR